MADVDWVSAAVAPGAIAEAVQSAEGVVVPAKALQGFLKGMGIDARTRALGRLYAAAGVERKTRTIGGKSVKVVVLPLTPNQANTESELEANTEKDSGANTELPANTESGLNTELPSNTESDPNTELEPALAPVGPVADDSQPVTPQPVTDEAQPAPAPAEPVTDSAVEAGDVLADVGVEVIPEAEPVTGAPAPVEVVITPSDEPDQKGGAQIGTPGLLCVSEPAEPAAGNTPAPVTDQKGRHLMPPPGGTPAPVTDQKGLHLVQTPGGTQSLTVTSESGDLGQKGTHQARTPDQKGVCQTDTPTEPPVPIPTAALSITPDEQALAEEHGLIRGKNARGEAWWIAPAGASQAARALARELNFNRDATPQRGDAAERGSEIESTGASGKVAVRAWDGAVLRAEAVGGELVLPAAEALASRPLDLELEGDLPCRVDGLDGEWLLHGTCVRSEDHLAMVLSADRQRAAVVLLEVVKLSQSLSSDGYLMRTLEQEKAGFEPDVRLVTTTEGGVTRTVTAPLEGSAAAPAVELKELPASILQKLPADVAHHGNRPCRVVGDPHEWLWVCSRPASGNALLKRKAGRRWLVVSCVEGAVQLIQPQVEAGDADAAASALADAFTGDVLSLENPLEVVA